MPHGKEIMQVRASNGTRFFLEENRMVESNKKGKSKYMLVRQDFKDALEFGGRVPYGFEDLYEETKTMTLEKVPIEGATQRNKKFISIGCMRFVGKERIKLLKWAKA